MFFLLLLSVLQICFLPGFIVFLLLNRKTDETKILMSPVIIFGLSLLVNYLVIQILIPLHLYTRSALIIFILFELLIIAGLIFFRKHGIKEINFSRSFKKLINEGWMLINFRGSVYDKIKSVLFILSVLLLVGMTGQMILNIGKIFHGWDAIFSWNRWAIDLHNNIFPVSTYHYPQLIPANWSISYVLAGYPLQFIPKAMMPLFLIFQVYAFIVLAIKRKSFAFIYASIFLFLGFNRLNWTEGFVDVPVAFYSILVYISLVLINKDDEEKDKLKYVLISALIACASAVTKQSGIFVVLIFPLLLIFISRDRINWSTHRIIKSSLLFIFLILIIIVPYYVYAEMAIKNGFAASEVPYVTKDIYNGASWTERVLSAGKMFSGIFSSRALLFICIIPFIISFTDRTYRFLNLSIVLPFLLVWTLFFSYDLRNSAIAIPYICLAIGAGFSIILNKFQNNTVNEH